MMGAQDFSETIYSSGKKDTEGTGGSRKTFYPVKEFISEQGSHYSKASFGEDLSEDDYQKEERGKFTYQMLPASKRKSTFAQDSACPPLPPVGGISLKSLKHSVSVSNDVTPKSVHSRNLKSSLSQMNSVTGDSTPRENKDHTQRS